MPETQQTIETPDEPAGKTKPRSYRVLLLPEQTQAWYDAGWHPGSSPESAIKAARSRHPEVRESLAAAAVVVAIPEAHFNPMRLTVEVVEKESFKKVDAP